MARVVECVPNFSEGRRKEVIEAIVEPFRVAPEVTLLDYAPDADHNRTVVTVAGDPENVLAAVFEAIRTAASLIDMEAHTGEHPRMGATDVVPFVPIREITMTECVDLARRLGSRVGEELGIPVFLYEAAATRPERTNLADIRRGQYEGWKTKINDPDWKPDFGPSALHPSAGATVVGARMPLVAFNVNLGTSDMRIANSIARAVRHIGGGLRFVKALGIEMQDRGIVQVSMNLTNYTKTPIYRVMEMIRAEARRYGIPIISSEIIGLTPAESLFDVAAYYLQLEGFSSSNVLENRMTE